MNTKALTFDIELDDFRHFRITLAVGIKYERARVTILGLLK